MTTKKRALGKGLSALLTNTGAETQPTYDIERDLMAVGTIGKVPLSLIERNPFQPREHFDDDALKELAASILEKGVIQPVTVRKTEGNKLQLISGERRFKAAEMAGLDSIPAYIITATEHDMLEMAIIENIQRENLNPLEIALGYKQLQQHFNLTQDMMSERLGKSRSSIANYMRLLNLPGEIQIGVRNELISMGHARALLGISNTITQLEVFNDIIAESLSVRDVEEIVKTISDQDGSEEAEAALEIPKQATVHQQFEQHRKDLAYLYDCKVQMKSGKNGKGSITLHFKDDEELDRILTLLKK